MAENNHYRNNTAEDKYAFSEAISKIINNYNAKLATEVRTLKDSLGGTKIALFDAAGALQNLMNAKGPNGESNFDYGIDINASFTKLSSPNKPDIKIGVKCYKGGYLGSLTLAIFVLIQTKCSFGTKFTQQLKATAVLLILCTTNSTKKAGLRQSRLFKNTKKYANKKSQLNRSSWLGTRNI